MNIGILFADFGPYHACRIDILAKTLKMEGLTLIAYKFTEKSETYSWLPVNPKETEVITLRDKKSRLTLKDSIFLAFNFYRSLRDKKVKVILLPSYSPLPNFFCLIASVLTGARRVIMTDSWSVTASNKAYISWIKKILFRFFNAAFVAGSPHVSYAKTYGLKIDNIFMGYDVVDNKYYNQRANFYLSENLEGPYFTPSRFFLSLGRFVPKKNLLFLIKAYAEVVKTQKDIGLVFVGEGEEKEKLIELALKLSLPVYDVGDKFNKESNFGVYFYPFQQSDITPYFYSKCEAFILPSIYEEWGLVINEAMACGAPVIVSKNVGCSIDLVRSNYNGYIFDPNDVDELSRNLDKFLQDPLLRKRLGRGSSELIENWGLDKFAQNGLSAIKIVLDRRNSNRLIL